MLIIEYPAWQMLRAAAKHKPNLEIAGFAKGRIDMEAGEIYLTDILIPPQDIGGAHAEMEAGDLDWLMGQIVVRSDQPKDWFIWWHSHTTMGIGPSSQDHKTLFELAAQHSNSFALGLIVYSNHTAPVAWAAYKSPLTGRFVEQDFPVEVDESLDVGFEAIADQLTHVTERKWYAKGNTNGAKALVSANGKAPEAPHGILNDPSEDAKDAAWSKYITDGWQTLSSVEGRIILDILEKIYGDDGLPEDSEVLALRRRSAHSQRVLAVTTTTGTTSNAR